MDPEQFPPTDSSQSNTANTISYTASSYPGGQFSVSNNDLKSLRRTEMLPDNILDAFMEHLVTKSGNDDITHLSVHFLYTNPATQRVSVRQEMLDYIGGASQILIPVHMDQPLHYFLILVNRSQLQITVMDSLSYSKERISRMNQIVKAVQTAFDVNREIEGPWEIHYDESCPKQDNGMDCGIYVLHYAESVLANRTTVPFNGDIAMKYRERIVEYFCNRLGIRRIDKAIDSDPSLSNTGK
jgi:Ulp1 family protease